MAYKNANTGNWNTGYYNTGNWNIGDWNTGDRNTGDRNTGNCNTGDYNTGNWNTGDWNTGDYNTGYWNTGNWNTGYCNSVTPDDCLIFNKPGKRSDWIDAQKPQWMCTGLTKWVPEEDMSDKEKEAYPSYVTTGGYLKAHSSLKAAFVDAWEKAPDEDQALTRQLPNFDEGVFEEVFGFNPWKQDKRSVTLELTNEQLERVKRALED